MTTTTDIRTPLTVRQFYFSPKKLLAVAAVLGAWAYTGFMSPAALLGGFTIDEQCVKFAKEETVFAADDVITSHNLRMRNGNFVVDLFAHSPNDKSLKSRVCKIDGSSIEIVSMFEAPFWR